MRPAYMNNSYAYGQLGPPFNTPNQSFPAHQSSWGTGYIRNTNINKEAAPQNKWGSGYIRGTDMNNGARPQNPGSYNIQPSQYGHGRNGLVDQNRNTYPGGNTHGYNGNTHHIGMYQPPQNLNRNLEHPWNGNQNCNNTNSGRTQYNYNNGVYNNTWQTKPNFAQINTDGHLVPPHQQKFDFHRGQGQRGRGHHQQQNWSQYQGQVGNKGQKKKKKIDKRELPENNKFFCDSCDRGFPTEEKYTVHVSEHQKCTYEGCPYIAAPRLVQLHINLQHSTGIAKKIWSLESQEDIEKWKEERKKNFPTTENIARKKMLLEEKKSRGEVIETKYFGKMKGRNFNQQRFDNEDNGGEGEVFDKKNRRKRRRNRRNKYNNKGTDDSPTKRAKIEDQIETKDGRAKLEDQIETRDGAGASDRQTNVTNLENQIELDSKKGLSDLGSNIEKTHKMEESEREKLHTPENMRDEDNCPIKTDISVGSKNDNFDSSMSEKCTAEGTPSIGGKTSSSPTKNGGIESRKEQQKHNKKDHRNNQGNRPRRCPPSLLEKLLANDIRHERNVILQCVHYIVRKNFFDIGKSPCDKSITCENPQFEGQRAEVPVNTDSVLVTEQ